MADGSADAAPPKLSLPVGFGVSRISQACLACRRKKVTRDLTASSFDRSFALLADAENR